MAREIKRDYIPTPELIKDGLKLAPVPVLSDDWIGLHRLLTDLRKTATDPRGTITGRTFRTAVEPDQRVEIDTPNGIRIFNSDNELTAQFDGDTLNLFGGTIIGATFKTALSPNKRVEIDSVNGIRLYDSLNVLTAQLNGADILLNNIFSLADPTTFITLATGGVSFADNSAFRGTFSSNGLLITSTRIAFNTYTSADVGISSSGTTLLIGKADGSSFADLEARDIIATSSFSGPMAIGNITGLGSGVATFLATPSSVNLKAAMTDETGSGALVFANTPTLVTPVIGVATGTSLSVSGNLTANTTGILGSGSVAVAGSNSGLDLSNGTTVIRVASDGHLRLTSQNSVTEVVGALTVTGTLTPTGLSYTFGGFSGSGVYTNFSFADGFCVGAS